MQDHDRLKQELAGILDQCFAQVRFARAVELARSRRYLEAEGLLAPKGQSPPDASSLDLLARIAAQRRQFDSARRLWEAARQLAPENEDYKRLAQRAAAAERKLQSWRKAAIVALLTMTIAAAILALARWLPRSSPAPMGHPSSTQSVAIPTSVPPVRPPASNSPPTKPKPVPPLATPTKR